MARSGGLTKWFKQNWVDIGSKKKMDLLQNVEDQSLRRIESLNILSAYPLLKLEE